MTRTLNAIAGSVLLLVVLPVLALIVVVIMAIGGQGPTFVRQRRISGKGVSFLAWRFRSEPYPTGESASLFMTGLATQVGTCVRRYNLDSLPMLLNVIAGDLSLLEMAQS